MVGLSIQRGEGKVRDVRVDFGDGNVGVGASHAKPAQSGRSQKGGEPEYQAPNEFHLWTVGTQRPLVTSNQSDRCLKTEMGNHTQNDIKFCKR